MDKKTCFDQPAHHICSINTYIHIGESPRLAIFTYKNRFFFLLQTVFSLKNNASKFQFILRHETVFVQINICVNNCAEVIDASV